MSTRVVECESELAQSSPSALVNRAVGCCAEVLSDLLDEQGLLLDSLIDFAFDVLDARYLALRIVPAETATATLDGMPS